MTYRTWTAVAMQCDRPDCQHHGDFGGNYDVGDDGLREWQNKMREQGWRFGRDKSVQCPGCTRRLAAR